MKRNCIREWIAIISSISVIIIVIGIALDFSKNPLQTPKYYYVIISLISWMVFALICMIGDDDTLFPQFIVRFLKQPWKYSIISFIFIGLIVITHFVAIHDVNAFGETIDNSLRLKTEEKYFCCIHVDGKPFEDCGCLKFKGKLHPTVGFYNRLTKGKKEIATCDKCRLTVFTRQYKITQIVNCVASVIVFGLSVLHCFIEKKWTQLNEDERKNVIEEQFVEMELDKLFGIKSKQQIEVNENNNENNEGNNNNEKDKEKND